MGAGLKATIVGPLQDSSRRCRQKWDKFVKKKHATPEDHAAAIAAYLDESVPNLSSIVVLAEARREANPPDRGCAGRLRARGAEGGRRPRRDAPPRRAEGAAPRQQRGTWRWTSSRQVTADHYVISANGKYGNPDPETLEMIAAARGTDELHDPPHQPRRRRWAARAARRVRRQGPSGRREVRGRLPRGARPIRIEPRRPARILSEEAQE